MSFASSSSKIWALLNPEIIQSVRISLCHLGRLVAAMDPTDKRKFDQDIRERGKCIWLVPMLK